MSMYNFQVFIHLCMLRKTSMLLENFLRGKKISASKVQELVVDIKSIALPKPSVSVIKMRPHHHIFYCQFIYFNRISVLKNNNNKIDGRVEPT